MRVFVCVCLCHMWDYSMYMTLIVDLVIKFCFHMILFFSANKLRTLVTRCVSVIQYHIYNVKKIRNIKKN